MITKIIYEMSLRYDAQKDILYAASALDPRFKALPFLSAKEQDDTFSRLQTEAATAARDVSIFLKSVQFNKNVFIEN